MLGRILVVWLALASLAAAAPAAVGAAACTAGSSGIGDGYYPLMGNSGYDASQYTLDLDLDVDNGAIRAGVATMTALAHADLCRFNLDFNGLDIDAITVDGLPAAWSRDGQELSVSPARPVRAGSSFVVVTRYHGKPAGLEASTAADLLRAFAAIATPGALDPEPLASPVAGEGPVAAEAAIEGETILLGQGEGADRYGPSLGGWWTSPGQIFVAGEPRGSETWYPVNGHPADKAAYTLRLTVDAPYDVVANGERVDFAEQDGRRTAVWVAEEPMASYLVTFYAGMIDLVLPPSGDGPLLRYAYGEAVPDWQREQLERLTPPVIAFFEERFGDYPYAVAGGMVVDASLWFALETQTIPIHGIQIEIPEIGFTRAEMLEPLEETIVHELAHQWFGNLVSPLRWSDVYLNEGLTQYATYLWIEQRDGSAALELLLRDAHDRMVMTARFSDPAFVQRATGADFFASLDELGPVLAEQIRDALGVDSVEVVEQLPLSQVLDALPLLGLDRQMFLGAPPVLTGDPGPGDNFSALWVYERGALATHALRLEVGDDAFFRILRAWVDRHGGGSATVQDFILLAEQETGRDLGPLFDAWLFQHDVPPFPAASEAAPATPAA